MAISRSVGVRPGGYFGPLSQFSAFAKTGGEIFHFVSTGANPNDLVGATYRVHVFDNVGDSIINFERDGFVDVFLIGGGGAGGAGGSDDAGGGGGAGGLITQYGLGISAGTHSVCVGRGGIGVNDDTDDLPTFTMGQDSSFAGITAFGGGGGGSRNLNNAQGGGSGGGSASTNGGSSGGAGVSGQGNSGGSNTGGGETAAGGGGAGEAGASISDNNLESPNGGDGVAIAFYDNVERYYSGGGAGASMGGRLSGTGGLGGGANSSATNSSQPSHANFYGGGGAGGSLSSTGYRQGGNGYQGLVMIRYRIY